MKRLLQFGLTILTLCLLLMTGCKERAQKEAIQTPEVTFTKEGELRLYSISKDSVISSLDIEIAETEYETQTGLMYRSGMADNQGMLFVFEDVRMHSFYMKNTEFPLDILFIDDQNKIVSLKEDAQPLDESGISSVYPVRYVLEVNAGITQKLGVTVGDSISFSRQ